MVGGLRDIAYILNFFFGGGEVMYAETGLAWDCF